MFRAVSEKLIHILFVFHVHALLPFVLPVPAWPGTGFLEEISMHIFNGASEVCMKRYAEA